MVAQNGQDVLLKIDVSGSRQFQTVAGIRSSKIALNSQMVNVTHIQSDGRWRELLEGGGLKTASLTGSGVFLDAESDARMRQAFFDGDILSVQAVLPDFGTLEGRFQITALEYSGKYDGEMQFDIALASAGALEFSPHLVSADETDTLTGTQTDTVTDTTTGTVTDTTTDTGNDTVSTENTLSATTDSGSV